MSAMHFLIGFRTNDYVILASDKSAFAYGAVIVSKNDDKTVKLGDKTYMAVIGETGDVGNFSDFAQRHMSLYKMKNGYELSPKSTHFWLRKQISEALRSENYWRVDILLGGYDDKENKAWLSTIDYLGNAIEEQKSRSAFISTDDYVIIAFTSDKLVSAYKVLILSKANSCQICQEQGIWSEWSGWSLCQQQYGTYSQTRTRTCSNSNCYGANSESIACVVQHDPTPSPTPEWNQWGDWSTCSASCEGGFQYRQRTCDTECGVCQCQGATTEQRPCNEKPCCQWKKWSAWSPCSITCGDGGIQYRTRECSCKVCPFGVSSQQRQCSQPACPVYCPICEQPTPPPPTCNICEPPPPPCSSCGYYGRKKRQQNLETRKMINSMVIPAGTNFTSPVQQQTTQENRLSLFIGMKN